MVENIVRFATVGSNFIVKNFLSAAALCDDFVLKAVYSRSMEKAQMLAKEWGAEHACSSLEQMAASEEIDAVYIASPNICHAQQAIIFMEAGKHVLCEKPIALSVCELKKMQACAEKNHVVLMEAMRPLHNPNVKIIREILPQLGIVRRAVFQFCQYSSRYDKFKNGIVENAFIPQLGNGALMDIGVYCIHMMLALFGKPERIQASGYFLPASIDAAGTIVAEYGEMQAQLLYSKINDSHLPCEIQGEEACLRFSPLVSPETAALYRNNGEIEMLPVLLAQDDMRFELESFIRQVRQGHTEPKWGEYSMQALEIVDEVRRQIGIDAF